MKVWVVVEQGYEDESDAIEGVYADEDLARLQCRRPFLNYKGPFELRGDHQLCENGCG